MNDTVLSLGERIVLAARLAAIEHVRQAIEQEQQREQAIEQTAQSLQICDLKARWHVLFDQTDAPRQKGAA